MWYNIIKLLSVFPIDMLQTDVIRISQLILPYRKEVLNMRIRNRKVSKMLAGCLAMIMALESAGASSSALWAGAEFESYYSDDIKPVEINETTFPDDNFRAVISGPTYDRDGNGILDEDEIILARNVWCNKMGIKSLKGIEYLVELRGLYCMDNEIETMDLSRNKLLQGIWCSGNKFKTLDFTPNPELIWVYCFDCELTSLNVANNPKMAYIECNTNPLTELDVSNNPELEHLMCGSCELTTLDLSHNPNLQHLDAFRNHFKTLDISNNPKMKRLDIWDNAGLGSIDISNAPGLQYYNCANNDVEIVDVSNNPELNKLICSYNNIKKLDLSHNPKLVCLNCEDNQLESLDLSYNPKMRYLQAAINNFSTLNIGNNPYLVQTYKEGKFEEEWFGVSWTIDYGGGDSTGGDQKFHIWVNDDVTIKNEQTVPLPEDDDKEENKEYTQLEIKNMLRREAVVQVLYEMAGKPSVSGLKSRFTDVESGSEYENALLWGEKNSICVGYPNISSKTFGVGKWITRQDLAMMLMRYSEYKDYERSIDFGRSDDYIDYFDIDYDHWEAICWSATWNIMDGKGEPGAPKSEQRIDPYGKATHAEFKEMLKNLYEVNKISAPLPVIPFEYTLGDINKDGYINSVDASEVLTYYTKAASNKDGGFSKAQKEVADVDGNGAINVEDAMSILLYYAYLSTTKESAPKSIEVFVKEQ